MSSVKRRLSDRSCAAAKRSSVPILNDIVQDYIARIRPGAASELSYYGGRSSLAETIRMGAMAIRFDGKRHDHQRRIPAQSLTQFAWRLTQYEADIRTCRTFAELHTLVKNLSIDIDRIGALAVYDTTTRIGAKLRLFPREVYLHAGTKEGASALGVDTHAESVSPSVFPHPFKKLRAYEIEDFLCIYKSELRRLFSESCHL